MAMPAQAMTDAQELMLRALVLLDEAGEVEATCYLQQAFDVARGIPVPRTINEVEAQLDTPEARVILNRCGWGPQV